MGIGRFFRKIEQGGKNFFKKGGIAESGLRKLGNTLSQAAPIINKIGDIAGMAAPVLSGVPVVGGVLSKGAEAFSKQAPNIAKAIKASGKTTKGVLDTARQNRGDIGGIVSGSLDVVKDNIQKPKPKPEIQPYNAFDELPFA